MNKGWMFVLAMVLFNTVIFARADSCDVLAQTAQMSGPMRAALGVMPSSEAYVSRVLHTLGRDRVLVVFPNGRIYVVDDRGQTAMIQLPGTISRQHMNPNFIRTAGANELVFIPYFSAGAADKTYPDFMLSIHLSTGQSNGHPLLDLKKTFPDSEFSLDAVYFLNIPNGQFFVYVTSHPNDKNAVHVSIFNPNGMEAPLILRVSEGQQRAVLRDISPEGGLLIFSAADHEPWERLFLNVLNGQKEWASVH